MTQPKKRRARQSRGPLTRRQLLAVLAGLVLTTLLVLALLLSLRKAMAVELRLQLDELSFTVVPAAAPSGPGVAELLAADLRVRSLQLRGAESFAATLAAPRPGRATAAPGPAAAIALRVPETVPPFQPALRLRRPTRVALLPSGHGRLTITLEPVSEPAARRLRLAGGPGPEDWICEVLPRPDLELRLQDVALAIQGEPPPDGEVRLEPSATAIVWQGGGRPAELGLQLAVADTDFALLLAPDLEVSAPTFHRFDQSGQDTSFVVGGRIVFPDGDREPLDLGHHDRLRLPGDPRLTLRSLTFLDGGLDLTLSGRLARLEVGSTMPLMEERLPNLLVWLRRHELPTLIFSALGVVVGLALALLNLLGLVKKD